MLLHLLLYLRHQQEAPEDDLQVVGQELCGGLRQSSAIISSMKTHGICLLAEPDSCAE